MRRAWKHLAEYADNQTFEADQIRDAVIPALERDCKGEIGPDFLSKFHQVCGDRENSLFKTDTQPLESLRAEAGVGNRTCRPRICYSGCRAGRSGKGHCSESDDASVD